MQEQSFVEYILEGMGTILMAITVYFSKKTIDNIDDAGNKAAQNSLDLANFKTHVADNYAKAHTLERVHDRIDDANKQMDEISGNIKVILHKMGKL